jgi:hypothetical protein
VTDALGFAVGGVEFSGALDKPAELALQGAEIADRAGDLLGPLAEELEDMAAGCLPSLRSATIPRISRA